MIEDMDEEARKSCHDLYIHDYKCLLKSIQDITQLIKREKDAIERNIKENESRELYEAAAINNANKVNSLLENGIADVDWQNPESVLFLICPYLFIIINFLSFYFFDPYLSLVAYECTQYCKPTWSFRDV